MKLIVIIYAGITFHSLFQYSTRVGCDNSMIEQNFILTASSLNAYHPSMDAFKFKPNIFEYLDESNNLTIKTTTADNFTTLFYNFKMFDTLPPGGYHSQYYATSLLISPETGSVEFVVSLRGDFQIRADVYVKNLYSNKTEKIIHEDSVSVNLRNITFSKMLNISKTGSIQKDGQLPQITIDTTKICFETYSQHQTIIYTAIETLIDRVKKQMEVIWMKEFEQQIDSDKNYFPMRESTFSNKYNRTTKYNRDTQAEVYVINQKIEPLLTFGIITDSITIEGLSDFAELKMTVLKDAQRQAAEWVYHCDRTTAQIETNKLRGQLKWYFDDSSTQNVINYHLDNFVLKVTTGGGHEVILGEIQIDPVSSYCACSRELELLRHVFVEKLKSAIHKTLNDRIKTAYLLAFENYSLSGSSTVDELHSDIEDYESSGEWIPIEPKN